MADRPVPDRPGRDVPSRSADAHGMSWVALAALLFMVLVVGWRLVDFWDSRQPPSGVSTQEATVVGFQELGRSRAGSKAPEYSSVVFELPDGERASALYELRVVGDAEKGDTITVYEQGDAWRTTSEKAWGSTVWWGVGMVVLLTMVVGWFRVRARARKAGTPTT